MDKVIINGVKCHCGNALYRNEDGIYKCIDDRLGNFEINKMYRCGTICDKCWKYIELDHILSKEVQNRALKRYDNYFYHGICGHLLRLHLSLKVEKDVFHKRQIYVHCDKCKKKYKISKTKYEKFLTDTSTRQEE